MTKTLTWPFRLIGLAIWFAWQIALSSVVIMRDVLTHDDDSDPIIIEYRTRPINTWELAMLALMVNITPGTLVLSTRRVPDAECECDPSENLAEWSLFVHVMYQNRQKALAAFRETETRILNATRARGLVQAARTRKKAR
ncbi:Na+/H+ antiporter subunit E [Luteococcus sp. Sow4_B9]|uniref:Na+/H+ antiporter subunit E n=1 Tax=Luteococcus sp. Sow4_B9 TaxID=3438792 RepID=UPI003F95160E